MQRDSQQGGYPCSIFCRGRDSLQEDDLICSICKEVLKDPVQVCIQHHTHCRGCIAKWKATKKTCPDCRAPISREESARKERNKILELQVRCPNAGCDGSSGGGGSDSSSSSSGSSDVADAEDERQHKKSRQDDGAPSSASALAGASVVNPLHLLTVAWTGPLKDYKAHETKCPFGEISCRFANAGCAFRAPRRDMAAHCSDMGAHFVILMTTVAAVKTECASVKAECAAVTAAAQAECAAVKADNGAMKSDIDSLQLYVSILHASEEEAAAGGMEWVSSRAVPATDEILECTYTGQMLGGKSHGFGRASWETGDIDSYDGQWKDGKGHGHGVLNWSDGDSYEGQWKDDMMHGQGIYKNMSGDIHEGRWIKDLKQGRFICTRVDFTRWNEVYKDDNMTSQTPIA
jgi:hypothetical protein